MTIPIALADISLAWLPFRDAIPWDSFIVTVPRERGAFTFDANASAALAAAMAPVTPEERRRIRRAMLASRRDLLWTVPGSRVHEHVLREAARGIYLRCAHAAAIDVTDIDTPLPGPV